MIPTARPGRVLFLVSLAAAAALSGCGRGGADAPKAAPPPMPVTVISVAPVKVPVSLEAVGQAEGSREVEIRARVNGIIEKRLYEEGSAVNAGATLFVIDPAPYELAQLQAKAALQQERVRRELAEVEARRLEPLVKDKAISQRELDQAEATAKQATAAIAAAEAKLKEAELNLSYTQVKAPVGGISGRALKSEGSLVTANTDSSLLTTVTQVNPVWVRFPLAAADFERVRGGRSSANVQIITDVGAVVVDHGKLNFAASTVDGRTGAVQLRAEFPNPRNDWMPGQFVKVRLLAGEQMAIRIPQAAVLQSEQSRQVMLAGADNKVVARPVKVSGWVDTDAVVTDGLKEGDRVIVDNLVKLRPGMVVAPKGP